MTARRTAQAGTDLEIVLLPGHGRLDSEMPNDRDLGPRLVELTRPPVIPRVVEILGLEVGRDDAGEHIEVAVHLRS